MLFRLFLLFSIVPVIELAILIYMGSQIGVVPTIALVIFTAAVGAWMVRREGLSVIWRFKETTQSGQFPGDVLIDGAMILVSGALLLTPGLITDVVGFALVFPPSREILKKVLKDYIQKTLTPPEMPLK